MNEKLNTGFPSFLPFCHHHSHLLLDFPKCKYVACVVTKLLPLVCGVLIWAENFMKLNIIIFSSQKSSSPSQNQLPEGWQAPLRLVPFHGDYVGIAKRKSVTVGGSGEGGGACDRSWESRKRQGALTHTPMKKKGKRNQKCEFQMSGSRNSPETTCWAPTADLALRKNSTALIKKTLVPPAGGPWRSRVRKDRMKLQVRAALTQLPHMVSFRGPCLSPDSLSPRRRAW